MRPLLLSLLVIGTTVPTFARTPERILIPYYTAIPIEGAHGSRWVTELAVLNNNNRPAGIQGYEQQCHIPVCPNKIAPPGITFYPSLGANNLLQGVFLEVWDEDASEILVQLRARDLSRQSDDWGAEVPTIRESMAPVGSFGLLDIPTDVRYRVMLRLYHFANDSPVEAHVRFFQTPGSVSDPTTGVEPDRLLTEETVVFTQGSFYFPGFAQLPDLVDRHPVLAQSERIRIEVSTTDPTVRIWGFATITNNETQHVTVISAR